MRAMRSARLRRAAPLFVPYSLALALALALALPSCADDAVLPDSIQEPVCGNNLLESGEQCDVASPGCVACVVVPTWSCTTTSCKETCGDGVLGTGDSCESPRREEECS